MEAGASSDAIAFRTRAKQAKTSSPGAKQGLGKRKRQANPRRAFQAVDTQADNNNEADNAHANGRKLDARRRSSVSEQLEALAPLAAVEKAVAVEKATEQALQSAQGTARGPDPAAAPASSDSDVICLDDDEDDDCIIIDQPPPKRLRAGGGLSLGAGAGQAAPASHQAGAEGADGDGDNLDDDEDLRIVGITGQVVTRDLPHPRPDCAEHRFLVGSLESNCRRCNQCYCYVCDVKASECEFWGTGKRDRDHANAHSAHPAWTQLRQAARAGNKTQVRQEFEASGPLRAAPAPPRHGALQGLLLGLPLLPGPHALQQQQQGRLAGGAGGMQADLDTFLAAMAAMLAPPGTRTGSGQTPSAATAALLAGVGGRGAGRGGAGGGSAPVAQQPVAGRAATGGAAPAAIPAAALYDVLARSLLAPRAPGAPQGQPLPPGAAAVPGAAATAVQGRLPNPQPLQRQPPPQQVPAQRVQPAPQLQLQQQQPPQQQQQRAAGLQPDQQQWPRRPGSAVAGSARWPPPLLMPVFPQPHVPQAAQPAGAGHLAPVGQTGPRPAPLGQREAGGPPGGQQGRGAASQAPGTTFYDLARLLAAAQRSTTGPPR